MDDNRKKALSAALGQIEKQFGKGSVMRFGDSGPARDTEAISTGSLGLDIALGIGGLPKGRVIEIYGPESSGKTTMTLSVIAEAQKDVADLFICETNSNEFHSNTMSMIIPFIP